eukprot:2397075-Amphidinium_carterae.1
MCPTKCGQLRAGLDGMIHKMSSDLNQVCRVGFNPLGEAGGGEEDEDEEDMPNDPPEREPV